MASVWCVRGILGGSADCRHAGVAKVAGVAVILLLVAVARVVVLVLVIGRVLSREPSLDSLVHCCALQPLLRHRIVAAETWICRALDHLMLGDVTAAHHIPTTSCLLPDMLILLATVEAGARSTVRIASTVSRSTGEWSHIVGLTIFLNLSKYAESTLRRDQTGNNFLRHIFRGSSQQVLELDRTEFLNDGTLLADALMETFLKFVQFALLFVQILDQPPSSFLHLMKSPL